MQIGKLDFIHLHLFFFKMYLFITKDSFHLMILSPLYFTNTFIYLSMDPQHVFFQVKSFLTPSIWKISKLEKQYI